MGNGKNNVVGRPLLPGEKTGSLSHSLDFFTFVASVGHVHLINSQAIVADPLLAPSQ